MKITVVLAWLLKPIICYMSVYLSFIGFSSVVFACRRYMSPPLAGCVVESTVGLSCAGDPQRLAHHQHQHHEGRIQGLLVCPDCWVSLLVQRRGGEAAWWTLNAWKCLVYSFFNAMESKWAKVPCNIWYSSNHVAPLSWCYICCSLPAFIFVISSLGVLSGEREEVHAASGQPEAERCGEGLHVQQTRLCHLQHRTEVCIFWGYAYLFCNLWWTLKDIGCVFAAPDPNPYSSSQHQMP